ncbi:MAG: acyl-CoA dehydrogenase family protein [Chloroflexi bacterium]|nr:acyl-CoA dehydrogenase family protein [Chloroflexota bacterium]
MDFELTKQQEMVRKVTRDFIQRELTPEVIREHERAHKYPAAIIKKMAALGLTSTTAPREYGGAGMDWVTHGLICEEIGGAWFSLSLIVNLVHVALVQMPLVYFGTDEQKQKYLPRLAKAEITGCVCAVEPNVGSDALSVETKAELDGDSWVISGAKTWITNASSADILMVLCQTDKSKGLRGLALILVEKGTPGLSVKDIEGKTGLHACPTCEVKLQDVRVPKDNVIGQVGRGFQTTVSGIANVRYSLSAACTGIIQACADASAKYAKERSQFGKPIGSFQLVQEMIANMLVDAEASRLLYLRLGYLKDKGLPCEREASIAKLFSTEAALRASTNAIKIHGAYGYCDEFPVERHFRDVMGPTIFGGTSEIHRLILGRDALGLDAFR